MGFTGCASIYYQILNFMYFLIISYVISPILFLLVDTNVVFFRLEVLNEKRSAAIQMVKLAEKERDSLEVYIFPYTCMLMVLGLILFTCEYTAEY